MEKQKRDFCYQGHEPFADTIAAELKTQYVAQAPGANGKTRQAIYVKFFSPTAYRSHKQNSLFHSLLGLFWDSGLSSYDDPESMREHYKGIAGLIKTTRTTTELGLDLTLDEKKRLFVQISKACLSQEKQTFVFDALKNKRVTEEKSFSSWADATKKGAKRAIDCLIDDMIRAGVSGQKFDEIMNKITKGEWSEYLR